LSWNESINKRFNTALLHRGLIVGKSGCGKSMLLLNLLLRPGWLDYNKLYMFGKSLFQPEYRIFKKALEEKLPKEAVIRLFDNQKEIQKLNVSPSALMKRWAKISIKNRTSTVNFTKHHMMYRIQEISHLTKITW